MTRDVGATSAEPLSKLLAACQFLRDIGRCILTAREVSNGSEDFIGDSRGLAHIRSLNDQDLVTELEVVQTGNSKIGSLCILILGKCESLLSARCLLP